MTLKNYRISAIGLFNWEVVKNEHDRISFHILYPAIHSNKSFNNLLKSFIFTSSKHTPKGIMFLSRKIRPF